MTRIGAFLTLCIAVTMALVPPLFAQDDESLIQMGVTGSSSSRGADNPFTLIRNQPVERLLLQAAERPVTKAEIEAALAEIGLEAGPENFVRVGALRQDGDRYTLAFNLFTAEDQRRLEAFNAEYASSLADAILDHRDEFDAIFARYDLDGVDLGDLRYLIIGCFILDWDGLTLTAEQNYRRSGPTHPNGDTYTLWSREKADDVTLRDYFWGSHNAYFENLVLTSFGDHDSSRIYVLPDLSWSVAVRLNGSESVDQRSRLFRRAMAPQFEDFRQEAARTMMVLRDGPADLATLAERTGLDPMRIERLLPLLDHIGYVIQTDELVSANIVLLGEQDLSMMQEARALGWRIMGRWLADNYQSFRQQAEGLTPSRFDVPFERQFTQFWHYIFGAANHELAQRGYFSDQYADGRLWQGHTPMVWWAQLNLPASFGN